MPLTDDFEFPIPEGGDAAFVPSDLTALAERVEEVLNLLVPIGEPRFWLANTLPEWFTFLAGQQNQSRTTFAKLFALWGTTFGAGNGSTTFGFPDLRARMPIGADAGADRLLANNALGDSGGLARVSLLAAELAAHQHAVNLTSAQANTGHTHGPGSLATAQAGAHQHGPGSLATASGGGHSHGSGTLSMNSAGSHTHRGKFAQGAISGGSISFLRPWGATADISSAPLESDGSHQHSISGSVASAGSHSHPVNSGQVAEAGQHGHAVTGASASSGQAHTHAVSGNTASQGSGNSHENMPPYIVGYYIVRYGP